jgi:predicted SPOUT superfamily RNA methylase MTH1
VEFFKFVVKVVEVFPPGIYTVFAKLMKRRKKGKITMQRREQKIVIAIPVSVISEIPHLREKTLKIGLIGRAAAIFRVNEIIVFSDNPGAPNQKRDRTLIATLLTYMETPQYLRKHLFKLKSILKYAGILPPLRTPHHPLERRARKLKMGEHRDGVIIAANEIGSLVEIGVERPVLIPEKILPLNKRVTVTIKKAGKHPTVGLANRDHIKTYWGYIVTPSKTSFGQLTKSRKYNLVIATSKIGSPLQQVTKELSSRWKKARSILVGFGAPSQGLQEIVAREKLSLEKVVDYTINTIPDQGTETVRTEEAIYASLALLNMIST